jgi:hypothetical protein
VALSLSCQVHGVQLKTWLDEKSLKADYDRVQVGYRLVSVLPDAYFVVGIPSGELHFFVEYDRGDEPHKVFKKKLDAYWAYFRSGKCRARYGTGRIRVLTVTDGEKNSSESRRLINLRQLAKEQEEPGRFWFSDLGQVSSRDFLASSFWLHGDSDAPATLFISATRGNERELEP